MRVVVRKSIDNRALQSSLIRQRLQQSSEFKQAQRVCINLSMHTEVDTLPIVHELLGSAKRCFVPYIVDYEAGVMQMVEVEDLDDLSSFQHNRYGILEPPADDRLASRCLFEVEATSTDLLIVPGLAFDRTGRGSPESQSRSHHGRLGMGGGFYDRYLTRMRMGVTARDPDAGMLSVVGLAFQEQIVDRVPMDKHDWGVDHVLTAS
jgi:5-formyltetrahydrofolate cyclo-ligase